MRPVAAALVALLVSPAALAQSHAILSTHLPDPVAAHQAALVTKPDPAARMLLAVSLPQRNQAALTALLLDITDPRSPTYRHYLSVAEFTDRFGPTASDYAQAISFFSSQGLKIVATAPNRMLIDVEGAVADIERVFHVTMGLYRHPTEARLYMAPDREPTLDLAVPVLHVTGLDDFIRPTPRLRRQTAAASRIPLTGSGAGGNFIASDIRAAYYGHGTLKGTGQSVGLMELGGYEFSDVQNFFASYNQKLDVPVNGISTDGAPLGCKPPKCDDGEQTLDIDYAIGMAPALSQVQVYVGYNAEDVLNRQATDNTSKQLSTSWGWSFREAAADEPIFREMIAQGQTLLTASGDNSTLAASDPWPEEDAYIVAVGGTDLATHGAGGSWASETGWQYSAGGPALQNRYGIAPYQKPFINQANGGSGHLRNVPDIAGDADFNNIICADGGCGGGWGGTSFASPIWSGFIALVNERAAQLGKPTVGFINPALYALALSPSYADALHDETKGKSGLFSAVPSFDLVTGLGSPQPGLIDLLAQ